MNNRSC